VPEEVTGSSGFHPVERFTQRRRNLPHIQEPGRAYFITFRVKQGRLPEEARRIALDACLFWNGKKCEVHACVVMPDHVHLLVSPFPVPRGDGDYSLSEILHSIKSYSANKINKLLNRRAALWLDESYDRIMRDEKEFFEKWHYIRNNPVTWELVDFPEDYPFLYEEGEEASATGRMPVPPEEQQD
jgi:REP element-mobilizing transposase RayT